MVELQTTMPVANDRPLGEKSRLKLDNAGTWNITFGTAASAGKLAASCSWINKGLAPELYPDRPKSFFGVADSTKLAAYEVVATLVSVVPADELPLAE